MRLINIAELIKVRKVKLGISKPKVRFVGKQN